MFPAIQQQDNLSYVWTMVMFCYARVLGLYNTMLGYAPAIQRRDKPVWGTIGTQGVLWPGGQLEISQRLVRLTQFMGSWPRKKIGGTSVLHFLVFLFVARNQNEPKGHQVVKKVGDGWADGTQSSQIRSSLFCFFKNWSGSSQVASGKNSSAAYYLSTAN